MLNRYKVKCLVDSRSQIDVYHALNPDHAAQLATEHLRTSYPLSQTKIIRIECMKKSDNGDTECFGL